MTGDPHGARDIVDVVMRRAADQPNQVVAIANERGRWIPLTAGVLGARVQALAVGLSRQGIGPV
jgi:long-subunit acyl-CoA synthetase (AMP-forming)